MELPRKVVVGSRIIDGIDQVCRNLNLSRSALILTGVRTGAIAGDVVEESLRGNGFRTNRMIIEESTISTVREVQRVARKVKPRVILGVGGGKTIDVAKLSSALEGIPFISVPTAASHDGIASTYASIKGLKRPISVKAQAPLAIVADTSVIIKSPYRLTRSGCGDVIAKLTAVRDWQLAHKVKGEYYGEYAANLALMSAKLVMRNVGLIGRNTEEGLRILLEALISCGVAASIAGSTRPCSGSEHLFSHALDKIAPKPALHGEQCGVGAIMMAYLHRMDWERIRYALKVVGAPTNDRELGIESEHIINALMIARDIRRERYTILSRERMTEEKAKRLAEVTGTISS